MRNLEKLQETLQSSILQRSSAALVHIAQPAKGDAESAFAVYQDAYGLRHMEFLANDHELLHRYMGDVAFRAMSHHYSAAYPSDHPNARWYSQNLPEFLHSDPRYLARFELASLARLEHAFNTAFDAADCPIFTMADAANVDPQRFGDVCLQFSTSTIRLGMTDNTSSIWSALRAEENPPLPLRLVEEQALLVWRQAYASRFRILGAEEAIAIDCALEGMSFSLICETIAMTGDADTAAMRAAGYLRGWFDAELISSVRFEMDDGSK